MANMDDLIQNLKQWLKLLATIAVTGSLCRLVCKICSYVHNLPYFQPCSLPDNKQRVISNWLGFMSILRSSGPNCPAVCLLFQALQGYCHIFEKEGMCRGFLLFTPIIFFYKPETVEAVLSSTTMLDKGRLYDFIFPWLGSGLLTSTGAKWRCRRKLLTPTFHFCILDEFVQVFQEQSSILVSKLHKLVEEPWIDIVPLISACTLDIICQTAMGVRINAQGQEVNDYAKAIHEISDAVMHRGVRPWLYPDIIFKRTNSGKKFYTNLRRVHELTKKVIKEKKTEMLERGKLNIVSEIAEDENNYQRIKRKAFLELLLELHLKDPLFIEEDIREEVDTFMFEGHDTTAMAFSWTFYCLGLYPDVQKKAHEELEDIFQGDTTRTITREDLTKMKYIECVIKEVLRLYPSVPLIARECNKLFKVSGHTVRPGSICIVLPYVLHQHPDSFPDGEKFIPERFHPENNKGRHPYSYVPFSAGPRNCIGQKFAMMEEKMVIASVLRRFQVTSLDPRDKVLAIPKLTYRNLKPLRLRFELR